MINNIREEKMVDNNKIASLGIQFSKKLSFTMIDKNNIDADESFRIYIYFRFTLRNK